MIVVVDASAAVEVILDRPRAEELRSYLEEADYVIAPDLYVSEVANALWKYLSSMPEGSIDVSIVEDAVELPDDLVASRSLYREAFSLSVRESHPVYDCLYLIVARRNSATLLTLDTRLATLAKAENVPVRPDLL